MSDPLAQTGKTHLRLMVTVKAYPSVSIRYKDLIFDAGNLANPAMRKSFMILGCCYPKDDPQLPLL